MSKISERLKAYQTQMSIYAEQHKVILASDVLDMIEQLQDDLKDSIDKVVEELEEKQKKWKAQLQENDTNFLDHEILKQYVKHYDDAIDIVIKGGAE